MKKWMVLIALLALSTGAHGVRVNLSDIPDVKASPDAAHSEVAYGQAGNISFNTGVLCNTTHCFLTLKATAPEATVATWSVIAGSVYPQEEIFKDTKEIAVCPCGTTEEMTIPMNHTELEISSHLGLPNSGVVLMAEYTTHKVLIVDEHTGITTISVSS
jgi:hypothetical protein